MNRCTFTLPVVAVLALVGCSSPAAQDGPTSGPTTPATTSIVTPTPTASTLPAGKFNLTTKSGADITFTLPTPATDPAVADLEAYRVKVHGAPVSYLVADVDNRKGTERINMYMVSAFNEEGRQYTFSTVTDAVDTWKPSYQADGTYLMPNGEVLSDAAGTPLSNQATELYNANINDADVAERTTIILASTDTDLPDAFTRVSVLPSGGMGPDEEAQPAS
jgi:hypothetical protein